MVLQALLLPIVAICIYIYAFALPIGFPCDNLCILLRWDCKPARHTHINAFANGIIACSTLVKKTMLLICLACAAWHHNRATKRSLGHSATNLLQPQVRLRSKLPIQGHFGIFCCVSQTKKHHVFVAFVSLELPSESVPVNYICSTWRHAFKAGSPSFQHMGALPVVSITWFCHLATEQQRVSSEEVES